jgi:hypothetical protein
LFWQNAGGGCKVCDEVRAQPLQKQIAATI